LSYGPNDQLIDVDSSEELPPEYVAVLAKYIGAPLTAQGYGNQGFQTPDI